MIRTPKFRLLAWLLIVVLPAATAQADVITVGSQAGAQIFFNNTLTRTYNFGVTQSGAGLTVTQLDVNVKGGNAQVTLSPVIVSIYNGLGGTGSVLGSGTIAAGTLTSQFQFISVPFSTLTLPAGGYSVVLSTTNVDNYYIKAGTTKLTTNGTTAVTSSQWVEDTNTDGNAGTTLNAASTVLATWTLGTNAYAFGNYRVGTSLSATTALVNTALVTSNTMTQALAATGTTTGGVNSLTGLPSPYLSVGGTSNVVTGLNGATTGPNSGTATLSFNSVSGTTNTTGTTAVGSGTIALTGTGYNWANAKVSAATLAFGNVRTGSAATAQTVAVGNQTVVNATYQDRLNVSGSTNNAAVSATGFSNLAASTTGTTTGTVSLAANTTTAGSLASTVSLTYTSNANGVAGLSNGSATFASGSSAPSITTTGGVYDWANAKVSGTTLAFGNVRTGSAATAQTFAVGNQTVTNAAYQDLLNVTGSTGNGAVTVTGFSNLAASTSGATTGTVSLAANTATAGSLASTVSLTYTSNANGVAGLSNGSATIVGGTSPSITTTGGVYDYANAVYTGTAFNFGIIHQGGAAASGTVAIGNQTVTNASYQDSLNVSASTGNALVSASGFTGLAASAGGATRNNLVVSIATSSPGSLASTVAPSLVSNANGVAGLSNGTATVVGSPGSITTTGTVYSGQSVWNTNGSGQWGTLSSNFGTNWQTFNGSPGLDGGFTDTDTATFGGVVTSGTATVTITAATPSVKSVTFANAAASYVLAGASGGSLNLLNAGTSAAGLLVSSGSHAISAPVALGSNLAMDVGSGSWLALDGALSGAKNLTKQGAGTAVLAAFNTYSGTTSVESGRLLIHGSQLSATGPINVLSGATLGGRGAAGGAVTVFAGGTLSPGASVESLAVGATTFSGSSTFYYEVDSSAALSAGADLLAVSGNLSIQNGALLQFADLANVPTAFDLGTKFTLISYGTNTWDGGYFTYGEVTLADDTQFTAGLNDWRINYNDTTGGSNFPTDQQAGSYVTITAVAVPEPESIALLAAGLLTLGIYGFRPRRRRSRTAA